MLSQHRLQLGKYWGQTFKWLLENDVGYTLPLIYSHQKERERSSSQSALMANKDALTRYAHAFNTKEAVLPCEGAPSPAEGGG